MQKVRESHLVSEGDVIMSPKFIGGVKAGDYLTVGVDEEKKDHAIDHIRKFHSRDPVCFDADPSRGEARYVVVEVESLIRSKSLCQVTARRLTPDGKYDPSGEVIQFGQSCAIDYDPCVYNPVGFIKTVTVVGRERRFASFELFR